jgi:hypothetical protein
MKTIDTQYIDIIKKSTTYNREIKQARKDTREFMSTCFRALGLILLLLVIFIIF